MSRYIRRRIPSPNEGFRLLTKGNSSCVTKLNIEYCLKLVLLIKNEGATIHIVFPHTDFLHLPQIWTRVINIVTDINLIFPIKHNRLTVIYPKIR